MYTLVKHTWLMFGVAWASAWIRFGLEIRRGGVVDGESISDAGDRGSGEFIWICFPDLGVSLRMR